MTGTLRADQYTYLIVSRSLLLTVRNVPEKNVAEKIKTHILCPVTFIFENHAVYEIMWKNIAERGRPQMTIWCMCIACWIPKATDTHSEYVILISLPLQQWLHGRVSLLHYTYTTCHVSSSNRVDCSPFSACHFCTFNSKCVSHFC